jgi:PEP-CTERM motif
MKKKFAGLALAAGALFASVPATAAITLVFTASATQIAVGDTTNIDVSISGLGAEILSAYDLNFLYSASVLGPAQINRDISQFGANALFGLDSAPGDLGYDVESVLSDDALSASQADSFFLFTFQMSGLSNGFSNFGLGLDADLQRLFIGRDANPLTVDIGGVCIAVGTGTCAPNPTPEPASLALVGLALAGAYVPAAWRRRRQQAA